MKRLSIILNFLIIITFVINLQSTLLAQEKKVRQSLKASVTQRLGVDTDITIDYSRPGVKGRKIWGELIPFGLIPGNKYSNNKPYPWRAGANENSTIEFNNDVLISGKKIVAGKYGIHMIPSKKDWIVIFSKNSSNWGSFAYNEDEDALRINVTPIKTTHQEWLAYGFEDLAGTSATIYLHWEKCKIPFKIEVKK